ncbi:hypothetical protein QPK87_05785 [Kamptonema cortianum]|nr:hypothetical protein [Kamptonema cortianum]
MEDVTNEDERIEETPGSPESAGELLAPSPEALEQVEKLMQQANLAKIRGQNSIADKLLAEAIELAPQAPQVLLAIADDFAERRQFTKAKEAYKKSP